MSLFKRKSRITTEQKHEALRLLGEWEHAKNMSEWRQAARRLTALGGWDWWVVLARAAESDGNYKLVGQINCFAIQSKSILLSEAGYTPPGLTACRSIDEITVRCLRNAPPSFVIQAGSAGRIDVEKLAKWAAARMEDGRY